MEYNNYPTEDEQFEAADKAARLCGRGTNRRKARIPGLAFGRLRHTEIENRRWVRTEAMFHYTKQYEKRRKDTYYEIEQKNFEPGPGTGYGYGIGCYRFCRGGWGNHH